MLLAISPIDGRYQNKTAPLQKLASEYGLIRYRVIVEIEWFKALCQYNDIPECPALTDSAKQYLEQIIQNFDEQAASDIKEIEQRTNHDVKAVEYYLSQLFKQHPDLSKHTPFIHFACTSEDINNTAYALMLKDCRTLLLQSMLRIYQTIDSFAKDMANQPMLSRTHGQTASPTTAGKEWANVAYRLSRQITQFEQLPLLAKMNGAVGNFNAHVCAYPNMNWPEFSEQFIHQLGLHYNPITTQIEPHDNLAEWCHTLMRFNTIGLDSCRDTWGYISLGYYKQRMKDGEVGSSTMPHKVNPIDFENAEGNFGLANAIAGFLAEKLPVSRWQRDLSDSTVMRNIGSVFAFTLLACESWSKGLQKLEVNEEALLNDLDHSPEVLAEAIQTVMRKYGIEDAYEQLKTFSRGQALTLKGIQDFVHQLNIPEVEKDRLLELSPDSYTGIAETLALDNA